MSINGWIKVSTFVFAKLYHFEEIKDITIYSSVSGSFVFFLLDEAMPSRSKNLFCTVHTYLYFSSHYGHCGWYCSIASHNFLYIFCNSTEKLLEASVIHKDGTILHHDYLAC